MTYICNWEAPCKNIACKFMIETSSDGNKIFIEYLALCKNHVRVIDNNQGWTYEEISKAEYETHKILES